MESILVVEDDALLREELCVLLRQNGFETSAPNDFSEIPRIVEEKSPDLVLLDVQLGSVNGITLCARIRETSEVPVIFLTEKEQLCCQGVRLFVPEACLEYRGQRVDLTRNELKILYYLFRHPGEIVSRGDLTEYLWDQDVFIDDNALSVHMTRIRNKLSALGVDHMIKTKRGMGYQV